MSCSEAFAQTGARRRAEPLPSVDTANATHSSWSFLSLGACSVDTYLQAHPTYDGRGTIIAVLDDGVDPGIEGLLKTSEGKRKIIDVQDFSGTGDLYYQPAERRGDELFSGGTRVLRGLDKKQITSVDGKYYYAVLDEARFKNGLSDLNFNGGKSDQFGVLVFQDANGHYSAIVDGDADGDVSDEPLLSSYKEHGDLFRFRPMPTKEQNDERFLSGAVNIFPSEHRINLYFADGGHGTHVAGIAGGCNIDGQQGFNGVAPGAEMIALKFADNTAGGVTVTGSMKRAYEYVVEVAQQSHKPVIVNMSFGIGSELEGRSAMDEWLDSLLDAHPEITVCIAAGNEGPGLSNIGLPGTARTVITSAAGLPYDTGRDLYGVKMSKTIVWDFSSRGAELAKPDIVTPGTAISTVPDYVGSDRYNGTSMASPYTAGCCSVLISGMLQAFGSYVPNSNTIKRALELGATHIENMTMLDEGAGLVNVANTFNLLSTWEHDNDAPGKYAIKVDIPSAVGTGSAAFYRNGFYPKHGERTEFIITPSTDHVRTSRAGKTSFNAFDLVSTVPWIETVQQSIYHRGDGALEASVTYNENMLKEPGLYTGKVLAYKKGLPHRYPEFELWNTVVIPHELTPENGYRSEVLSIPVKLGYMRREFFRIPAGTKAVEVKLSSVEGTSSADAILVDNDGKTFDRLRLHPAEGTKDRSLWLTGSDLTSGVWEIDVKRGLGSDDETPSNVTLSVKAYPVDVEPEYLLASPHSGFSGAFNITNNTTQEMSLEDMQASVEGYERFIDTTIKDGDAFSMTFARHGSEHDATFDISLDRADYDLFTDIGLRILRPDSSAVHNGGFDWRSSSAHIAFDKKDTSSYYILAFGRGIANPERPHEFTLHIRERREFDPISKDYRAYIASDVKKTWPGQTERCSFVSDRPITDIPKGYRFFGTISGNIGDKKIEFPVEFGM